MADPDRKPADDRYAPLWFGAVVAAGAALTILMLLRSPSRRDAAPAGEAELGVAVSEWTTRVPEIVDRTPSRFPDQSLGQALRDRARSQGATSPVRCAERDAPDLSPGSKRIGCAYEGEDWADVYYWVYDGESRELAPLNALAVQITPPSGP